MAKFSIINYLSGLTGFVLDKSVLERIAIDRGVYDCEFYSDLTTEDKDMCMISLLETVLASPNTMAGSTNTHGAFTQSVTQQVITPEVREDIKRRLRVLYDKYGMEDELNAMNGGTLCWLNENSIDY